MTYFLGLEVTQKEERIFVSQRGYAKDILKRFKMESCNPISIPVENGVELRKSKVGNVDPIYFKSLLGSLRYLTCTRPDILYGDGLISKYMETPDQSHLNAAKRILHYIKGTINKVCFIPQVKTSILLATRIVIGLEIWMKGKAQLDLSFSWEILLSHDHPRSN